VAELHVLETAPQSAECVTLLEEYLAKAQAGEISCIAFAAVDRDGQSVTGWTASPSFAALLGSVARLSHRMNTERDEEP
jgi:hypothetical protein